MDRVEKNKSQGRWAKYLLVSYAIRRASYVIRMLAGAYLVYLMYQLFSEAGKSQEELTMLMAAVGALMMAAGIYFVIGGAYALLNGIYAENEPLDEPGVIEQTDAEKDSAVPADSGEPVEPGENGADVTGPER